jgi:hypothetical protein
MQEQTGPSASAPKIPRKFGIALGMDYAIDRSAASRQNIQSRPPSVISLMKQNCLCRLQGPGMQDKPLMLPEQGNEAAARSEALVLSLLRAGGEVAEPAEQPVGLRLHDEYVHLVVGHADVLLCQELVQGIGTRPLELARAFEVCEPDGQVDVLAFVKHLPAYMPQQSAARGLLRQRSSY